MRKTVQQLFQEFLYESEFLKKVRPATLNGYMQTFRLFVKLLPECSLETISCDTIIRFFKILQERKRIVGKGVIKIGVKKSTVSTYSKNLSVFFEWMVDKKYIEENPLRKMRNPSPEYEDRKYLKKEEIERIFTAIHIHQTNLLILKRNLVLFYILLFCGLRKQELLSLRVRDIDLDRRMLTISGDTSKSARTRYIPLHSSTIMYLKDYLNARKGYTSPYLFISSLKDERLSSDGLIHIIQKLRYRSGVAFHLHQLRHTFAVNFLNTSNNIVKLKQLLGHKNITMTLIYLRCLPISQLIGDIESMNLDTLI